MLPIGRSSAGSIIIHIKKHCRLFSIYFKSLRADKVTVASHILAAFALFLSRVHQVHSFVTSRKSSQAMRPYRQHLLLNKLLLYRLVEGAICDMRHQKNPAHSRRSVRHCAGLTNRRQSYAMSIKKISTYVEKSPPPQIFRRRRLRWVGVMLRREAMSLSEKSANRLGSRARSSS